MYETEIEDLKGAFGDLCVRQQGEVHYVRLAGCGLPAGCKPRTVAVLLKLVGKNRPEIWVQSGITGPHGGPPRSCTPDLVDGESWMKFSYNFPWAWEHGLVVFVGAALRRFEKHE
jgi:hypothetical protein